MQSISKGDNLHEMSKSIFRKNNNHISKLHLLIFLPSMLSVKDKIKIAFFVILSPLTEGIVHDLR